MLGLSPFARASPIPGVTPQLPPGVERRFEIFFRNDVLTLQEPQLIFRAGLLAQF